MMPSRAVVRRPLWTWLCGVSSVALLLLVMALAAHVRIALGRWPEFGENYNSALFHLHELILLGIGLFTVYAAPLTWALLLCFRPFRISRVVHVAQVLVYGSGWLLIVLAGKCDPTPFTNWFLD